MNDKKLVGVIMGSQSDWETMRHAVTALRELEIPCEHHIVSAHRTPERLYQYARDARGNGLEVIIAGAGGAAHLPGMTAAMTELPVLGVPVKSSTLNGVDSLLSIVQMPGGIPTATFAIGKAGAKNAALFAASILGLKYPEIQERLRAFREKQTRQVGEMRLPDEPETPAGEGA